MSGIIGLSPNMKSGLVGKYPSGHVLDVKYVIATTGSASANNTTYVDAPNLTLSITPKSGTNKILITVNLHLYIGPHADNAWRRSNFAIHRTGGASTGVVFTSATSATGYSYGTFNENDTEKQMQRNPIMWLDSPATTSEVTYKIQYNADGYHVYYDTSYGKSEMTLMEITV